MVNHVMKEQTKKNHDSRKEENIRDFVARQFSYTFGLFNNVNK